MRRLTLILSDLYLPADAVRESFPTALALPALEALLRFADAPRRIDDWRSWLAMEVKADPLADRPIAHVHARVAGIDPAGTWLATPVRLEARLDHVRLANRGILRLPLDQLGEFVQEFQETFGSDTTLTGGTEGALLLKGGPIADLVTVDPVRLLDADIGAALPAGPAAGELRRLSTEVEMWLPGARINASRERAGLQKMTSLWFWGGGAVKAGDPAQTLEKTGARLFGSDSFLAAMNILVGTDFLRRPPAKLADVEEGSHAVVEMTPMSGPANESLGALDENWFAPAGDALARGRLESVQIVANDRVFTARSGDRWKFWRRKRGWLESLA